MQAQAYKLCMTPTIDWWISLLIFLSLLSVGRDKIICNLTSYSLCYPSSVKSCNKPHLIKSRTLSKPNLHINRTWIQAMAWKWQPIVVYEGQNPTAFPTSNAWRIAVFVYGQFRNICNVAFLLKCPRPVFMRFADTANEPPSNKSRTKKLKKLHIPWHTPWLLL